VKAAGTKDEGRRANAGELSSNIPIQAWIFVLLLLALGLRLLAWRWHELYDLGGDEREYFNQALTLLRDHAYVELILMRPPLYTGFLAACIYLFDSLVQRLRLVQAIISALTIVPIYLLARRLFDRRIGLIAALLAALSYTLAAHATELLTETLFVFGLALLFWLLVETTGGQRARTDSASSASVASDRWSVVAPLLAGLNLGALALLRSVALPLLPLGALWLLLNQRTTNDERRTPRWAKLPAQTVGYSSVVAGRRRSVSSWAGCSSSCPGQPATTPATAR
jgi:4-amino-4-deoxy-L-arabinose transferase-like glycosyltransferase